MKKYILFLLLSIITTVGTFAQQGEQYERKVSQSSSTYSYNVQGIKDAIASLRENKGIVTIAYPGIDTAGVGAIPPDIHLRGWHYYYSIYYIPFGVPATFDQVGRSLVTGNEYFLSERLIFEQQETGLKDHLGRWIIHGLDRNTYIDQVFGNWGAADDYIRIQGELGLIEIIPSSPAYLAKVIGDFQVTGNTIKMGTTAGSNLVSIYYDDFTFRTTDDIAWLIKQGNLAGDNLYVGFGDPANAFNNGIATSFNINMPEGWLQFVADSSTFNGFVSLRNDMEIDGDLEVKGVVNGVKKYIALISQTGTNAPTANVQENTLGITLVWTYSEVGGYIFTATGAFTAGKTIWWTGNFSQGVNGYTITGGFVDEDFGAIIVLNDSYSGANNALSNMLFVIEVRP